MRRKEQRVGRREARDRVREEGRRDVHLIPRVESAVVHQPTTNFLGKLRSRSFDRFG